MLIIFLECLRRYHLTVGTAAVRIQMTAEVVGKTIKVALILILTVKMLSNQSKTEIVSKYELVYLQFPLNLLTLTPQLLKSILCINRTRNKELP